MPIVGLLGQLIKAGTGASFSQDAIFQLIGQYLDLTELKSLLAESLPLDKTSILECLLSPPAVNHPGFSPKTSADLWN